MLCYEMLYVILIRTSDRPYIVHSKYLFMVFTPSICSWYHWHIILTSRNMNRCRVRGLFKMQGHLQAMAEQLHVAFLPSFPV